MFSRGSSCQAYIGRCSDTFKIKLDKSEIFPLTTVSLPDSLPALMTSIYDHWLLGGNFSDTSLKQKHDGKVKTTMPANY